MVVRYRVRFPTPVIPTKMSLIVKSHSLSDHYWIPDCFCVFLHFDKMVTDLGWGLFLSRLMFMNSKKYDTQICKQKFCNARKQYNMDHFFSHIELMGN